RGFGQRDHAALASPVGLAAADEQSQLTVAVLDRILAPEGSQFGRRQSPSKPRATRTLSRLPARVSGHAESNWSRKLRSTPRACRGRLVRWRWMRRRASRTRSLSAGFSSSSSRCTLTMAARRRTSVVARRVAEFASRYRATVWGEAGR